MSQQIETPSFAQIICSLPFRICVYGAITLGIYQVIYRQVVQHGALAIGRENGPLEMAQVALAAIAALTYLITAYKSKRARSGLFFTGALLVYAAARELDTVMENYLFDDAYRYLVGFPLLMLIAVVAYIDRKNLLAEGFWLAKKPSAILFAVASMYLCFVCQFLDRPAIWNEEDGVVVASAVRPFIEESMEVFAYFLLVCSSIEAAITSRATSE